MAQEAISAVRGQVDKRNKLKLGSLRIQYPNASSAAGNYQSLAQYVEWLLRPHFGEDLRSANVCSGYNVVNPLSRLVAVDRLFQAHNRTIFRKQQKGI